MYTIDGNRPSGRHAINQRAKQSFTPMRMAEKLPLDRSYAEPAESRVFVVDDDASLQEALKGLLESVGFTVETFPSTASFCERARPDTPSCLILDVRLKGESGLEFQNWAAANDLAMPIIFMSGYGDIEMSVRAMKAGAVNFLAKPFRDQDMIESVAEALDRDAHRLARYRQTRQLREQFASLTPRERDIAMLVAAGYMNKAAASKLELSEMTVKIYRARAMKKLAARTTAELVRKIRTLQIDNEVQAGNCAVA
ncbi:MULTISPECIES: response regulator transcription factor [unclassified Paraburkholderia]|uniref:response regulator transcription factor n=1 Tax=unclassified Paraburkholderia TaxID=2615204 RepID=UPI002AAFF1A7|nr:MULTISPECIES: response regulator [unclassified Paraburkholderia]